MANRIKGITVEIGGDTTKLQTALKDVNSEIKNTQSQLKDVDSGDQGKAEHAEGSLQAGGSGAQGRHNLSGAV